MRPFQRFIHPALIAAVVLSALWTILTPLRGGVFGFVLTMLTQVFLPGYLLSRALGQPHHSTHPVVRLVWIFGCGMGLTTTLAAALRIMVEPISVYLLALHAVMLALTVVPVDEKTPSEQWQFSRRWLPLYTAVAIACLLTGLIAYDQNRIRIGNFDDPAIYLGQAEWLSNNAYSIVGDVGYRIVDEWGGGLRAALNGWTYLQAVWANTSGLPVEDIFSLYIPIAFAPLIPLLYFALAYELTRREDTACWSAIGAVWFGLLTIDYLISGHPDVNFGHHALFMFDTLRKVSTTVYMPLALLAGLRYLKSHHLIDLPLVLLLAFSTLALHPKQGAFVLVSLGAMLVVQTAAKPTRRLLIIGGVLLLSAFGAAFIANSMGYISLSRLIAPDVPDPTLPSSLAAVNTDTISAFFVSIENVPVVGRISILTPQLIFYHPVILLCFVVGVGALARWRRSFTAQYLVSSALGVALLSFFPPSVALFEGLTGALVSVYRLLMGSVAIIPVPLILGLIAAWGLEKAQTQWSTQRFVSALTPAASVLVVIVMLTLLLEPIAIPYSPRDQMAVWTTLKGASAPRAYDRELIASLQKNLPTDRISNVAATINIEGLLVETVPRLMLTGGRAEAPMTANYNSTQRLLTREAPDSFWLDNADIEFITRDRVQLTHIIADGTMTRVSQMLLQPDRFKLLDAPAGFLIFEVKPKITPRQSDNLFGLMNAAAKTLKSPRWTGQRFELVRGADAAPWRPIAERWQKLLETDPDDLLARYGLAYTNLFMGKDAEAAALFESIQQRVPALVDVQMALAFLAEYNGDAQRGVKILLDVAARDDLPVGLRLTAASALIRPQLFYAISDPQMQQLTAIMDRYPVAWQQLTGKVVREQATLFMSRGLWERAQRTLEPISATELKPEDLTTQGLLLLAQGNTPAALDRLRQATDQDWINPRQYVAPGRWQNNLAAQTYYLLVGELARRDHRYADAERSFQQATANGNRWAGRYFLAQLYREMNQPDRVQALTETLNKEWQAENGNTPFPELVSLLTLADTGVIYLQQPELVRGSTEQQLAIRATFGSLPGQPYPVKAWRVSLLDRASGQQRDAAEIPAVSVEGALVRQTIPFTLPAGLPDLMAAKFFVEPRYDNRLIFGERHFDRVLNRPASATIPDGATKVDLKFDDGITLVALTTRAESNRLIVTLYWQADRVPSQDYNVFVHGLGSSEKPLVQEDSPPVQGQYPTSQWRTGTIISDTHALPLADGQIDSIQNIAVGMYRLTDLARLPILEKSDRVRDNLLTIRR